MKELPGQYPYTRGVYPTMYRGRLWTMRQYAGFGTAAESNKRFQSLLKQGQTGLSVAFDLPTQMGYDSDDPKVKGEVGRVGVAIDSLDDFRQLFKDIPLDQVSISMTINATAMILLGFCVVLAEEQGVDPKKLRGTIQNDILKEYIARGTYIYPVKPSLRLITDLFVYGKEAVPKWNLISVSGYHMREAGCMAVQEIAFTLLDGLTYLQSASEAGLSCDSIAPQMSFFFCVHNDFLEEIAKFRAARRLWAKLVKERFNPQNDDSFKLRFHAQTAGCSLTAQQPKNNIVRTSLQALAAVLGGTQSLHTNSFDEALALPTEESARVALRTQQILGFESGVANTVDPVAGSYAIEAMTDRLEQEAVDLMDKIEKNGGMIAAIEKGFVQQEIQNAAFQYQREIESEKRVIVGVNQFKQVEEAKIPLQKIDTLIEKSQKERLKKFKSGRNQLNVTQTLNRLKEKARSQENLMPFILETIRAGATLGEMAGSLKEVFGSYSETT